MLPRMPAARVLGVIGITTCIVVFAPRSDATEILSPTAARDLRSIIDTKVLRVAVTHFDLPAFHVHRSDGRLIGAEIEMAQQIAQALGVPYLPCSAACDLGRSRTQRRRCIVLQDVSQPWFATTGHCLALVAARQFPLQRPALRQRISTKRSSCHGVKYKTKRHDDG